MTIYIRDCEGRIINGNNVVLYAVEGKSLVAYLVTGNKTTLGVYSTPHKAKAALDLLSDRLDYAGCFHNVKKDEDII